MLGKYFYNDDFKKFRKTNYLSKQQHLTKKLYNLLNEKKEVTDLDYYNYDYILESVAELGRLWSLCK